MFSPNNASHNKCNFNSELTKKKKENQRSTSSHTHSNRNPLAWQINVIVPILRQIPYLIMCIPFTIVFVLENANKTKISSTDNTVHGKIHRLQHKKKRSCYRESTLVENI